MLQKYKVSKKFLAHTNTHNVKYMATFQKKFLGQNGIEVKNIFSCDWNW